ncbi:MAG TPA: O-antigen ligase family protein [Actinomycetota bacterium]|nr:O-antigen ligase family protein [Actinomycetota bacterium]
MRKIVFGLSLILIFTIPWEGAFHLPGLGTTATVMGLIVGACWLFMIVVAGQMRRPVLFLFAVAGFVTWVALTTFWSPDPVESLGAVYLWLQTLLFVYILWDLFRTKAALLAGLQAYVLGAYTAVGGAVLNYVQSNAFYTNEERYSLGNTNPDGYGFILALGIPVACYLAASPETPKVFRLINIGYLPVAFIGVALSGTRTASVGAAIGLLYGLATLTKLKIHTRVAVVVVLAASLFVVLPIVQPLSSFQRLGTTGTEVTQGDLNGRTGQWAQGLRAFMEHPILGVGTDMYRTVNTLNKVAHNSYLSVLVEEGLIGFTIFLSILGIVALQVLRLPKWDRNFWLTSLLVWAIGASTLTWEHRKTTWLFLTFAVAAAVIGARRSAPPDDVIDLTDHDIAEVGVA